MVDIFFPDEYFDSAYVIPYEELYKNGYRGIIYDIDNTLVPHGLPADKRSIELFERLKKIGFKCVLLSNNRKKRVDMFNKDVKVFEIWKAGKPGIKGYLKAMEMMETNKDNTLFVGDQIFTDIWGAKRTGIHSCLVRYIDPKEEIQIILKRLLEKPVINAYKKSMQKKS